MINDFKLEELEKRYVFSLTEKDKCKMQNDKLKIKNKNLFCGLCFYISTF